MSLTAQSLLDVPQRFLHVARAEKLAVGRPQLAVVVQGLVAGRVGPTDRLEQVLGPLPSTHSLLQAQQVAIHTHAANLLIITGSLFALCKTNLNNKYRGNKLLSVNRTCSLLKY